MHLEVKIFLPDIFRCAFEFPRQQHDAGTIPDIWKKEGGGRELLQVGK